MESQQKNRFHKSSSRVRVTDVAKLSGCSPATVSRAINNPKSVALEMRSKIEGAMQSLGYVPNHAARALRSQRSHMVGVLIPTLDYALYARLVAAANSQFSSAGLSTLIATFDYDLDSELKETQQLLERGAEALIFVGEHHRPELYKLLERFSTPFVNTYVFNPDSLYPNVGFDNKAASAKMTRHLVQLGHKRIGVISGITHENDRTKLRLEGIKEELESQGLELDKSFLVETTYSILDGRKACALLLSNSSPQPTAIVCGNDILALGAIFECGERGLRIPNDISIVGFDNIEFSLHASPALTTIDVPAEVMGKSAANFILEKLNGKDANPHTSVEVQLILRNSSAPPPIS